MRTMWFLMNSHNSPERDSVITKQETKVDKAENTGVRMVGWVSWQASELLFEGENGSGYSTPVIRLRRLPPLSYSFFG